MNEFTAILEKHYSEWPTPEMILENVRRKRGTLEGIGPADLYPYDQSHAGGIEATAELARRAQMEARSIVVDVGCGIGGAARYLYSEYRCRVIGIELTASRLRTALEFNRMTGVGDSVQLLSARAEAMPFRPGSADVVWTQHLTMNLPDHTGFVRECARVLRDSGRLALHEWLTTGKGELPSPLPWAPQPGLNHAVKRERFVEILQSEGFVPVLENVTTVMVERLRKDADRLARRDTPPNRLEAQKNLFEAAEAGLIGCWMIVAPKQRP